MAVAVSVVMVSYHTGEALWESIPSVLSQDGLHELIVIDNGNPKDVQKKLALLSKENNRLKVITAPENLGFAKACNKGVRQATGEYLLLLNPDCILSPGALKKVATTLAATPDAYVAGCFIANPDNSEQRGCRRNILTPWISLVESIGLHRFFPGNPLFPRVNLHEDPLPEVPFFVPAISGAFMLMRREMYHQLGGLDEGYFLHVEDLDFCLQVQKQGGKMLYVPDAKAMHYCSTSDVSSFFIEHQKAKGFVRYFYKNFKGQYFPGFLLLMSLAIYLRLGLKCAVSVIRRPRARH